MPTLRVVHRTGALEGREVVVSDDVVRLGRSTNCQVLFDESEQSVSRNHLELRWEAGALFVHPTAGKVVFRQGREVSVPTRVMPGDSLELVRVGGPKVTVFFEHERVDEDTAPTMHGVAPVGLAPTPRRPAGGPAAAAALAHDEDSKTENIQATPEFLADLRTRAKAPATAAAPSALEGADFDRAVVLEPGTQSAVQPVAAPARNGAPNAFAWAESAPASVAPKRAYAAEAAPELALDTDPAGDLPVEPPQVAPPPAVARPPEPPPPAAPPPPAPATPPPGRPKFQRPNLENLPSQLEGVQVERPVTIEAAPVRRKAKASGSSYTPLRLLYDLIALGTMGIGGFLVYAGSQMVGGAVAGVGLLLLIGRFFLFRGGGGDEDIAITPEVSFKKDELHSSAIDLSGITEETPDRVQRVARLLTSRGRDETVEVVDLVDDIIIVAEFLRASDCHIEPKERDIRISLRIDGVVQDVGALPKELEQRIANRFRIISKLDFAKADSPQDGRVEEQIRGKPMNLRVSVFPTAFGPKIVIRLLDSGAHALPPMEKLGIHPLVLKEFRRVISASQGIVLFTGPTGSGKTTLMYSGLREIIEGKVRRNVVTLEDPIERLFPQINQTQVDLRRGLTFASGLRTILRQDPDVIMVGEIRDQDTAEIALRAGQTGHLLLSTLHTNSAAASFSRLMDMGIEPFLLASAITGVASSRLMRRLCPHCRVQAKPPESYVAQLQGRIRPDAVFYEARGCEECRNTGYIGRMLAFELLTMNRYVADAIMARRSPDEIQKAATSHGMETILEDGLSKVKAGETSLEEVLRVLM